MEKADVDVAAECKAQESVKNGSGDAPEITKNGTSPTKPAQNNTVAQVFYDPCFHSCMCIVYCQGAVMAFHVVICIVHKFIICS